MPFIQNLAESYMGRKYMINNFLVDLYTVIRKKAILGFMIGWLKKEKTIPTAFHRGINNQSDYYKTILNSILTQQNTIQTNPKHIFANGDLKFESVVEISHEDSIRYLETPKYLKKIMKGRKPDETKMDSILSKTSFLKELSEKQRLTWASSIENEEL